MTALNKQALRELAEKATQGEWWSDVVETDGTYGSGEDSGIGFHSYAVYDGSSHTLLDMTNSTAACVHVEWDHDYLMAWDETAKRNAEFIAAANPSTVLALLDELETAEKRIAELEAKLDSADKLQDSAFRHGLQRGFSLGQTDNQAGFEECLSAYGTGKGE
ncbi:ead/Ea22-like family protein [Citrobacter sp. RHBSTW-00678]|uniref:ead/Ea22-like family protein n=1 Tax=Citrobacter sp. RHBSTW-00678 TaxID=2742661 RepID=UPI001C68364C|nr:ead/Ea22-like family protein [Citrobacter sp. RHBSTW-00678]